MSSPSVRLRQVAVVAQDLDAVVKQLRVELSLGDPYQDPGISSFGLENAVFAIGDTFFEVVSPVRDDTTAGRYLRRRGGDGGYMAIFQFDDLAAARARVAARGVRVVWKADLEDIAGTHLHPKDVPGAIVSFDWADPPDTWRWAGPAWTGRAPDAPVGGITGITMEVVNPVGAAATWLELLGPGATPAGPIAISVGPQLLCFRPASNSSEGITEVVMAVPSSVRAGRESITVGGIRVALVDAD